MTLSAILFGGGSSSFTNQGLVWTGITYGPFSPFYDMTVVGTTFCAVGGAGYTATSSNGATWSYNYQLATTAFGTDTAWAVATNGVHLMLGGNSGKIATSSDGGATWGYRSGLAATGWGSTAAVRAIVWNAAFQDYYVFGDSGKVAYSNSGSSWTYSTSLLSSSWGSATVRGAVWTGSLFCVVGDSTQIATSTGGVWTLRYIHGPTLYDIAWNGSVFCAVGASGTVLTSPDGITWTDRTSSLTSTPWGTGTCRAIVWTGSRFCVVGAGGRVAISPDGSTWTYTNSLSSSGTWGGRDAYSVAWNGTQIALGGADSFTAYSG